MRSARLTLGGVALFRIFLIAGGLLVQVACTLGGQEGEDLTPTGTSSISGDTDTTASSASTTPTDGTNPGGSSTVTGEDTAIAHTGLVDTGLLGTTAGGPGACDGMGPVLVWNPQATAAAQRGSSSGVPDLQLRVVWSEDAHDPMQSELQIFASGNRDWTPGSDTQLSWRWPRGLGWVDVDGSAVRQEGIDGEWTLFSGTLTAVDPSCWRDERVLSVELKDGGSGANARYDTPLGELRLEALHRWVTPISR